MTIEVINHTKEQTQITNFSKTRYLSNSVLASEWQEIWQTQWLLAGLESDLQNTGDFFVFELAQEQILVCKTSQGSIQGFFNVCQHRGNRLVTTTRGHAANFRCAYHAWTYSIDGALVAVPYEERFAQGVPCAERSLRPVHTETWGGFVFVNLSPAPTTTLDEFLGPVATMLNPYQFSKMVLVEDQTVHLTCNWKAVIDNFSELYHVDFLHPQHKRMVDCCNDTVHLFDHGHTGLAVPGATVNPRFPVPDLPTDIQSAQLKSLGLEPKDFQGRVMEVRRAVQLRKREIGTSRGMDYAELSDDQLSDVWQFNIFPNIVLSFTPEHCWVMRARPHPTDPNRCEFDKMSLVRFADENLVDAPSVGEIIGPGRGAQSNSGLLPADYTRPDRDVFSHEAILSGAKTMTDTIDQDIELLGNVQAGMRSAGFDSTWLNEDELRVQHFQDQVQRLLQSG